MHWKTFHEDIRKILQERKTITTSEAADALGITKHVAQKRLSELWTNKILKRTKGCVPVETFDYKSQRKTHKQACYVYALRED